MANLVLVLKVVTYLTAYIRSSLSYRFRSCYNPPSRSTGAERAARTPAPGQSGAYLGGFRRRGARRRAQPPPAAAGSGPGRGARRSGREEPGRARRSRTAGPGGRPQPRPRPRRPTPARRPARAATTCPPKLPFTKAREEPA